MRERGFSTAFKRNIGGFNLSYSFTGFDAQAYEVPNGAILHEEEDHDEEHDEEHDDHDEDHEEDMGTSLIRTMKRKHTGLAFLKQVSGDF